MEQIAKASSILKSHGIKHWIDFGSLLGAVRDGRVIDMDVDVDIDLLKEDRRRLIDLGGEILAETNLLIIDAPVIRACPLHDRLELKDEIQSIHSCARAGLLYVDLYVCEIRSRQVLHKIRPYSFRTYFIDELEEVTLRGSRCLRPATERPSSETATGRTGERGYLRKTITRFSSRR